MVRQIIQIDEEKCVGCGLCASTCQEGAIGLVDGKARLLREDHCDGLGNCLPGCPMDAISFTEKEFSDAKVQQDQRDGGKAATPQVQADGGEAVTPQVQQAGGGAVSQLKQWPVQIKLMAPNAPFLKNAKLLIAADCSAFTYGNFHNEYMKNKVTVIGCPKLDNEDYSEKLTAILQMNDIRSVTIVRMEVPCCGGIEQAAKNALKNSGKMIPWEVVTISTEGEVLDD